MSFSLEYLRSRLHYDKSTGMFTWKRKLGESHSVKRWNARYSDRQAGTQSSTGYINVNIDGTYFRAHRLAWFYVHGVWPPADCHLDHRDRDRANNRLENLRIATASENLANCGLPTTNTSGVKGVSARNGKWVAMINFRNKQKYLGTFFDKESAAAAYAAAAKELFGEFARAA